MIEITYFCNRWLLTFCCWLTMLIWISFEALYAMTNGIVMINWTHSIDATWTRTRIYTFISQTRLVEGTLGIKYAFWSASRVIHGIGTNASITNSELISVSIAWSVGVTWIRRAGLLNGCVIGSNNNCWNNINIYIRHCIGNFKSKA